MFGPNRPCTAILPWYEEADFAELLALSGHIGDPDVSYHLWYRSVMQAVDDLLRQGRSVEFVTIRPTAYTAWLRGRENTLEMRREFAEHLVRGKPVESLAA